VPRANDARVLASLEALIRDVVRSRSAQLELLVREEVDAELARHVLSVG
jgi:hypothetical protein